ncbi:hypothetical protein RUND412_006571 [Rhizina undulata]
MTSKGKKEYPQFLHHRGESSYATGRGHVYQPDGIIIPRRVDKVKTETKSLYKMTPTQNTPKSSRHNYHTSITPWPSHMHPTTSGNVARTQEQIAGEAALFRDASKLFPEHEFFIVNSAQRAKTCPGFSREEFDMRYDAYKLRESLWGKQAQTATHSKMFSHAPNLHVNTSDPSRSEELDHSEASDVWSGDECTDSDQTLSSESRKFPRSGSAAIFHELVAKRAAEIKLAAECSDRDVQNFGSQSNSESSKDKSNLKVKFLDPLEFSSSGGKCNDGYEDRCLQLPKTENQCTGYFHETDNFEMKPESVSSRITPEETQPEASSLRSRESGQKIKDGLKNVLEFSGGRQKQLIPGSEDMADFTTHECLDIMNKETRKRELGNSGSPNKKGDNRKDVSKIPLRVTTKKFTNDKELHGAQNVSPANKYGPDGSAREWESLKPSFIPVKKGTRSRSTSPSKSIANTNRANPFVIFVTPPSDCENSQQKITTVGAKSKKTSMDGIETPQNGIEKNTPTQSEELPKDVEKSINYQESADEVPSFEDKTRENLQRKVRQEDENPTVDTKDSITLREIPRDVYSREEREKLLHLYERFHRNLDCVEYDIGNVNLWSVVLDQIRDLDEFITSKGQMVYGDTPIQVQGIEIGGIKLAMPSKVKARNATMSNFAVGGGKLASMDSDGNHEKLDITYPKNHSEENLHAITPELSSSMVEEVAQVDKTCGSYATGEQKMKETIEAARATKGQKPKLSIIVPADRQFVVSPEHTPSPKKLGKMGNRAKSVLAQ